MRDIHLKVDDDVHRRLKVRAAMEDQSLKSYVEALIVRDLDGFELPKPRRSPS